MPLVFLTVFLISYASFAEGKGAKIKGWIATGIEAVPNGESKSEARIKISSKRQEGIKGFIAIEGKTTADSLELLDAFIDIEKGDHQFEIGQTKKRFGLEYQQSKKDRLAAKRSPLYKKLEVFAYVGREFILRFHDNENKRYGVSLGFNETQDIHFLGHYSFGLSKSFGIFVLLQSDTIYDGRQNVWAVDFTYVMSSASFSSALEIMAGIDPHATEIEKQFHSSSNVYFGGIKWEHGYNFSPKITLFYQLTYIVNDTNEKNDSSITGLIGLNYFLTKKLKLSLNLTATGSQTKEDPERDFYEKGGIFEAIYRF